VDKIKKKGDSIVDENNNKKRLKINEEING
jgi:hypothetical protein